VLSEGLRLMFVGMTAVFFFLMILIFITSQMSRIVRLWQTRVESETSVPAHTAISDFSDSDTLNAKRRLAAIAAAIHHHNK